MCTRRRYFPKEFRTVEEAVPLQVGPGGPGAAASGCSTSGEAVARTELPPLMVVEVTGRVRDGHFFLRPDAEVNRVILGVIGRAQAQLKIVIYVVHVLSNHFSLLIGVRSLKQASFFLNRIRSQIAVRVGELRGGVKPVWEKRASVIPVDGDSVYLTERMRYSLKNSVKEDLVPHAADWAGVHSARHLCRGEAMAGTWLDRTAWSRARLKDPNAPESEHLLPYSVVHSKLPGLSRLSDADYCDQIRRWCDEDAREAAAARAESRARALAEGDPSLAIAEPGPPADLTAVSVAKAPANFKPTPPPLIHASPERQRLYRALFQAYRQALKTNRERLQAWAAQAGWDFPWEGWPPTGVPNLDLTGWPDPVPVKVESAPTAHSPAA